MKDLRMIRRIGGENARLVEFGTQDGDDYVTLHYYGFDKPDDERHAILYIGVPERRSGTGRRLLELALADAKARDTEIVYGEIVSREGLEFFLGVLGTEFIDVKSIGDFNADPHDADQLKTRALLAYPLTEQVA